MDGARPGPNANVHLSNLTHVVRIAKLALPCAPGCVVLGEPAPGGASLHPAPRHRVVFGGFGADSRHE
jgi:hypothetical protein